MVLRPPFQLVGEAPEEAIPVSFDKFDLAPDLFDLHTNSTIYPVVINYIKVRNRGRFISMF